LIARAKRGDDKAFRILYEQHYRLVLRFLYGLVGNQELAEELTQETFIGAYKGLRSIRDESKFSTWLCAIAKNIAYKSAHSRRRENYRIDLDDQFVLESRVDELAPDSQLLNKELRKQIHDALMQLDEDKRLVFTLKVLQQRSHKEIAEITGFSIPKIKTDLHRAKAEMRRRVGPYIEVNDEV
jgi:RNA polymerase sigma-70 factor (ECF subfamily)